MNTKDLSVLKIHKLTREQYERALAAEDFDEDALYLVPDDVVQESREYPGCYYRIVGGVKEWLNPPVVLGEEYRTAERWDGEPVYTKLVNLGAASNEKKVKHGITATQFIRAAGKLSNIPMPVYFSENFKASISVSSEDVYIFETGYDNVQCTAQLWYIK